MVGVHRMYIDHLSEIISPLEALKEETKNRKFHFDAVHREAYDAVKKVIADSVLLCHPTPDGVFKIFSDYCERTRTVAAVLLQEQRGGEMVIGYASKTISRQDASKGTPMGELLGVHYALSYFSDIISGRHVKVYSDHSSLKGLNLDQPTGRWASVLRDIMEFEILGKLELLTVPGKENILADTLSRLRPILSSAVLLSPMLVTEPEIRKSIVARYHHHLSVEKMVKNIRVKYDWPGIYGDVGRHAENCDYCLRNRGSGESRNTLTQIVPVKPWQILGIDFMPDIRLKNAERKNVGIVVDYFTGAVLLFQLSDLTAKGFLGKLEELLDSPGVGVPEFIVGDNCQQWLSKDMGEFTKRMGIEMRVATSFHQQCNGKVENKVKMVKKLLHSFLIQGLAFRKALVETQKVSNNYVVSDSTGFTPFQVINGCPYEDDVDRLVKRWMEEKNRIAQEALSRLNEMKSIQKKNYDRGKGKRLFLVGDKVLLKNHYASTFMDQGRIGPFEVERVYDRDNYLISDGKKFFRRVNVQHLKKYSVSLAVPDSVSPVIVKASDRVDPVVVGVEEVFPEPVIHEISDSSDSEEGGDVLADEVGENVVAGSTGTVEEPARPPISNDVSRRRVEVGDRIEVYWQKDDAGRWEEGFYPGKVVSLAKTKHQRSLGSHVIEYDTLAGEKYLVETLEGDGKVEWRFV